MGQESDVVSQLEALGRELLGQRSEHQLRLLAELVGRLLANVELLNQLAREVCENVLALWLLVQEVQKLFLGHNGRELVDFMHVFSGFGRCKIR